MTLYVLELVQLADMFRFVVVYWVKVMNSIENIPIINRSKLLSIYDMLPAVQQTLSAVMYIQPATECSRPSAENHIDSFIPADPHVERKPKFLCCAFNRSPMFLYKERVKKPI